MLISSSLIPPSPALLRLTSSCLLTMKLHACACKWQALLPEDHALAYGLCSRGLFPDSLSSLVGHNVTKNVQH